MRCKLCNIHPHRSRSMRPDADDRPHPPPARHALQAAEGLDLLFLRRPDIGQHCRAAIDAGSLAFDGGACVWGGAGGGAEMSATKPTTADEMREAITIKILNRIDELEQQADAVPHHDRFDKFEKINQRLHE